jgi:hypothetical protein
MAEFTASVSAWLAEPAAAKLPVVSYMHAQGALAAGLRLTHFSRYPRVIFGVILA